MVPARNALIVDDERDIRELLVLTLGRMGIRVDTAPDVASAKNLLARPSNKYDLCLTDMRLPDGSGMDLIKHLSSHHPETPVAMITAYGNVEAAVDALKFGAFDFVSKPVDLSVLRRLVEHALKLNEERRSNGTASAKLIGDCPAMAELRGKIGKLARSQAPVYISGESGTGKELVARLIHEQGPRAAGPFVPINCGAIPTELMESEFFGHKKGAFTGAHTDKEGLFQAASGGTLFLDEVAELPLHMQVKLLRVIQEKRVRPVGGQAELPIDVRILSATHKNLAELVANNTFRHDLYYRINVIELPVPPLRDRREDIPKLSEAILARLAEEMGDESPAKLSTEAIDALNNYSFPGNVRELENTLERAMALCEDGRITPSDLHLPQGEHTPGAQPYSPRVTGMMPAMPALSNGNGNGNGSAMVNGNGNEGLPEYIEQLEREAIEKALLECRYNKTKAAAQLGITFRALRYKLKKLGID
ncbi:sigma-54-dependent transcriptional regulator [Alkalisalibacterium limincola]|uniref:Sigma-54-dependent Fis family transcriptional regulator n=1 Tax=Alkalisalibacterium limincola TaxID=2699169 RepID=A0A5C8KYA6_9GAMM|nr:sigma-54 dependent transcriptional regulator [Alkalisalibacterium limincola]TXK65034.1 sigma-54-dependent Fis family transcriptional regulator [Alkalisalibacterium limincola]